MKSNILIALLFIFNIIFSQEKENGFPPILTSSLYVSIENVEGIEFYKKRNEIILNDEYEILIQIKDKTPGNASLFGGQTTGFMESGFFNKGYKNGLWKTLHKRNRVVKAESWNNGLITGHYKVYTTSKKLLYETNFGKAGNGKYKDYYYATGVLKQEGDYENGKKQGEWCDYDTNGNIKKITKYISGIPEE